MLREALEAVAGGGCADVSTVDAQNKFDRGDSQHLDRLVVGTLSDGAHQGGGLNGQDAYTGRIFACARQPAHGADGQGDQHNLGRGADGDCVPERKN
jgi:hypothetical protein